MRAVHFGAGNIGRGFIGLLLRQAGYGVSFVDVNRELVDAINRRSSYEVELAVGDRPLITVDRVQAIHSLDGEVVTEAIAAADLVTTAVGPAILPQIAPVIASGISRRIRRTDQPLNVIACENRIDASTHLKACVWAHLADADRETAEKRVGFPDSAVDRIVPLQQHEDKLRVTVEPFFEWVVDQTKFVGAIPQIPGITCVSDLTPYVERKLYTVNTGHAVIAYLGYHKGYDTIAEAMQDDAILQAAQGAMRETGTLLVARHGVDPQQHEVYTAKILDRFANPHIRDRVTRVGRSPLRKLAPHDRLVGPALQCLDHGIVPEHLALGIAAALLFDFAEDPEAVQLQQERETYGWTHVLRTHAGLDEPHALYSLVMRHVRQFRPRP